MINKPFILVFTGPTGVGKTALVDGVADAVPSEIINIDMGQFYAPLRIGTAKPAWRSAAIPHHLFDVITEPRDFTVAQYRERVQTLIHDIWSRKKIPILVGGSGFYVRSLFFSVYAKAYVYAEATPHTSADRPANKPNKKYAHIAKEQLWDHLYGIDPERAKALGKQDYYRIERALDIWYTTGEKPSTLVPQFDPPCSFFLTCVTRDRDELYKRIDQRVYTMIEQGWIDEAQQLIGTEWESFLMRKKLIGYREIFQHLHTTLDKEALIPLIQQKTRNYAKRQMTFWRGLKLAIDAALKTEQPDGPLLSKTDEINLTLVEPHVYIKRLLVELQPVLKEL